MVTAVYSVRACVLCVCVCTVLSCPVLSCTVLYCTVLYTWTENYTHSDVSDY